MSPITRHAVPADFEAIVALDRSVRNESTEPAHTGDWLGPDPAAHIREWMTAGQCHVAVVNDRIVGYGVLHHQFFHDGMIDMLIVAAAHRRQGVGVALLRHLATQCRSEKLWVSTNLSNQAMQALLAKEGFRMSGFVEGLDEGDPELIYHKLARGLA